MTVIRGNIRKSFVFDGRRTVFELSGSDFDSPCGGKKTCGKCRIKITDGFEFVSEPGETEKKFISESDVKANIRYACMCEVFGNVTIELDLKDKIEVQTEGLKSKNITPDK